MANKTVKEYLEQNKIPYKPLSGDGFLVDVAHLTKNDISFLGKIIKKENGK